MSGERNAKQCFYACCLPLRLLTVPCIFLCSLSSDAPPVDVRTSVSESSSETHSLLGFAHLDLAPLLSVQARKPLTRAMLAPGELVFRRAPGAPTPGSSADQSDRAALAPGAVDPAQWNPQSERRLAAEVASVAAALPRVLAKAEAEGLPLALPALVQPPPPRIQLADDSVPPAQPQSQPRPPSASSSAPPPTASGSRLSDKERDRLAREAAEREAVALARQQALDPVYTLQHACVMLNCRPATGVGSEGFKQAPPKPSVEELAAAAATAQSKRGRKSPAVGARRLQSAAPADAAAAEA